MIVTRDVIFDETVFPYKDPSATPKEAAVPLSSSCSAPVFIAPDPTPVIDTAPVSSSSSSLHSESNSEPTSQHNEMPVPDSSPSPEPSTQPIHSMTTRSRSGIFKPRLFVHTISPSLPRSTLEALLIPAWKDAMLSEFNALLKNKTWLLTTLPPGKNLVGCTWIFKLKLHLSGIIARHKARLVAQGFSQQPGFDFTETFSPVVKPTTIRLILSLAVSFGWSITHLDVNNAFLNGELREDIYMRQPPGFEVGGPHLVCKLNKAIYGLKQASRAWFFTVHSVLISIGFQQSKADASMFFRHQGEETIYLLIYVDDMLITGNSTSSIQKVIAQLNSSFSLKDLGEVNLFLGVEVTRTSNNGLHLCQSKYIQDLLKKANMTGAKGCPTPMVSSCELSKAVGEPVADQRFYRSIVGALQYATITRPDINYAVNKVSQYMANPLDTHWKAVKRILRYLSGTLDHGIQMFKTDGDISAFSDSDWASDVDDRRSTTGVCAYHGRNLISWCVKKQNVVARSSTEAEYRSLAQAASEVTWLNSMLGELKLKRKMPSVIWVDNLSAIALASNPVLHARTKHIELDMHFVRDKVLNKELELRHVPTTDQMADIFTKPLSKQSFTKIKERLGIISLTSLRLRGCVKGDSRGGACEARGVACNLEMSNELCNNEEARVPRANTRISHAQAELVTIPESEEKVEDHLYTWRDVVIKGMKKKVI